MGAFDQKNRDAFTYTSISVLVMVFLEFVIQIATQAPGLGTMTPTGVYTTVNSVATTPSANPNEATALLILGNGTYTTENMINFTNENPIENTFDPTSNAFQWWTATTKIIGLVVGTFAMFPFLFLQVASLVPGPVGMLLTMIVTLWQLTVGYYVFKFVLPGRGGRST